MKNFEEKFLKSQLSLLKSQYELMSHKYPESMQEYKKKFNDIIYSIAEKYPNIINNVDSWLL